MIPGGYRCRHAVGDTLVMAVDLRTLRAAELPEAWSLLARAFGHTPHPSDVDVELALVDPARAYGAHVHFSGHTIDQALVAGLIEQRPPAATVFRFTHGLVRETLYADLGTVERGRLRRVRAEIVNRHDRGALGVDVDRHVRAWLDPARIGRQHAPGADKRN